MTVATVSYYRMASSILLSFLVIATPVFAQAPSNYLQMGRDYTDLFLNGNIDELWKHLAPKLQAVFTQPDVLRGMYLQFAGEYGEQTALQEEKILPVGEFTMYQRRVMFQKASRPMTFEWTMDPSGTVVGFYLRPAIAAPSSFLDYQDKVRLRLPFKGDWLVLSGGSDPMYNQHASAADQRFAFDILAIKHHRTFRREGNRPEQHYCFGRAILAPADGTVVEAVDGVPDNPVNAPYATAPAGNHVIIDHGNSEFSVLAHLRMGSLKVKAGQKVRAGEKIGRCGNSGNSVTPHLHIHLQNTPVLFQAQGLPIQFHSYIADKKMVDVGTPERGQIIRDKSKK
jgi:hypothetical protein